MCITDLPECKKNSIHIVHARSAFSSKYEKLQQVGVDLPCVDRKSSKQSRLVHQAVPTFLACRSLFSYLWPHDHKMAAKLPGLGSILQSGRIMKSKVKHKRKIFLLANCLFTNIILARTVTRLSLPARENSKSLN